MYLGIPWSGLPCCGIQYRIVAGPGRMFSICTVRIELLSGPNCSFEPNLCAGCEGSISTKYTHMTEGRLCITVSSICKGSMNTIQRNIVRYKGRV